MRDPSTPAEVSCLAAVRACPPTRRMTVRLWASSPRPRRSVAELLAAHAYAAGCEVAVAETRGIAVRWVDGIVTGTAAELAEFLTTVTPVLGRVHGHAALAA